MSLPIYFMSLPRPFSWAAASGLHNPRLPWGTLLGLSPEHRPWHDDERPKESFLRTPSWVFFHTSLGPGDHTGHRSIKEWAKEKGLDYPGEIQKGTVTGFARLEKVLPIWIWPDANPRPTGEDWHLAWEASFVFSNHHVVRDMGAYAIQRSPKLPPIWIPKAVTNPGEVDAVEPDLLLMANLIWHDRQEVFLGQ